MTFPATARRSPRQATSRIRALALLLLAAMSCRSDTVSSPDDGAGSLPVIVSAALTADQRALIAAMSVEVSGPGITVPIVIELEVSTAAVNGSVDVPVGANRRLVVHAYDFDGIETFTGEARTNVRPGSNLALAITLYPRTGGAPVLISVGTLALTLDAALLTLGEAETATIRATVSDLGVTVTSGSVRWGMLDPTVARATPSLDGRTTQVSGLRTGATTLVASIGGIAVAVPVTVGPSGPVEPAGFFEISAGPGYTCAIDAALAAWCWGLNYAGQLGVGTSYWSQPTPMMVTGGHRFSQVSTGLAHACAITDGSRQAWCWGNDDFGQLGDGVPTVGGVRNPQRVAGSHAWASIEAGHASTCGITTAGDAYCWGTGMPGQIGLTGDGEVSEVLQPMPVTVAPGPWGSLSLATHTSCGLRTGGDAVCSSAALSLVTTAAATTSSVRWSALEVGSLRWDATALPALGLTFTAAHACGITLAQVALCWGSADNGETGIGSASATGSTQPGAVQGGQGDYTAIAAGGGFSCGIRQATAFCWGRNDWGQLGDGSQIERHVPTRVAGANTWVRIVAGTTHTCAIRTGGATFCWGANAFGEVGDGSTTTRTSPVGITAGAIP